LKTPGVQYAALPWRRMNGELQILLVTTLNTRRWIVPKGWPVPGLAPSDCAAHEAEEEAGVTGEVQPEPIGTFHYDKQRKAGDSLQCRVEVFALEVSRQRRNWPEKGAREACWCSPEEALARVSEPGLWRVIARFRQTARGRETVRAGGTIR
jgi:8-oxo-dGTP pyrophosphatase MutT (NUDIX family)